MGQKACLDTWLNYLTSSEAGHLPSAYRYWAFAEILKMGSYDSARKACDKRGDRTAANFPELDQEALSKVVGVVKDGNGLQLEDAELKKIIQENMRS